MKSFKEFKGPKDYNPDDVAKSYKSPDVDDKTVHQKNDIKKTKSAELSSYKDWEGNLDKGASHYKPFIPRVHAPAAYEMPHVKKIKEILKVGEVNKTRNVQSVGISAGHIRKH